MGIRGEGDPVGRPYGCGGRWWGLRGGGGAGVGVPELCPRIVDSRGRWDGGDRPRIIFRVMWGSEVIVDSRGWRCGGGCPRIGVPEMFWGVGVIACWGGGAVPAGRRGGGIAVSGGGDAVGGVPGGRAGNWGQKNARRGRAFWGGAGALLPWSALCRLCAIS